MKSIRNYILNKRIKNKSEKAETVPIIQYMNEEFAYREKYQPSFDLTNSAQIPYRRLKNDIK